MAIVLSEVGAFPSFAPGGLQIQFGVYLPGVRSVDGFEVVVRVIHQNDRFNPAVQPQDSPLVWNAAHPLSLWSAPVDVPALPNTSFGNEGVYLYRFQLWWSSPVGARTLVTEWFCDPFARETDVGELSAVVASRNPAPAVWTDAAYQTPELDELIVYELQVEQFNDTFAGVLARIPYLQSLGVNCIELMPVTSTKMDFDWGYGPINYFAPAARFGGAAGLQALVDACHAANIAVILDVVYQHVDKPFAYYRVYADIAKVPGAPQVTSPMIKGLGDFGPTIDYTQTFSQDYVATCNQYWLDTYHVDGFRYDEVTDLYSDSQTGGPAGTSYALLAYSTYLHSLTIPRFLSGGADSYSRIIQCAEALSLAPAVLQNTYTSCAWQDDLLNGSEAILSGGAPTDAFAHTLDPSFAGRYPSTTKVVNVAGAERDMPVAPFQYLNSHDHSHLIVSAGTAGAGLNPPGDRRNVWRLQPFAIALLTSQGIPMFWEGEEICDNYNLPDAGAARINLSRVMNWQYFYDWFGNPLVRVYRRAGQLRRSTPALRSRESFYYNQQSLQGTEIIAYHRHAPADAANPEQYAMVLLNFAANGATINVPFPKAGVWTEQLDADARPEPWTINVASAGDAQSIDVPSNYGCIFVLG
jgi:maltooligosyltrehalose trehalohydrolase